MLNNSEIEKSFFLIKLQENLGKINEIFILQQLSVVAVKAAKLLHELQKERGHSSWYLGTRGENRKELDRQRKTSDLKMQDFANYLESINQESFNKEIFSIINHTVNQLSTLEEKREKINLLDESIDSSINYFSELIADFISLTELLYSFKLNTKLTRDIKTYVLLLKLKEKTGQERATLTGTFSEGQFNLKRVSFFLKILEEQKLYEKKFLSKATIDQINLYNSKIGSRILNDINDFRNIAIKNLTGNNFGVSTGKWFRIITNKIELLKEVEDKIAYDINNDISNLKTSFHFQAKKLLFNITKI
jgi:methyl-accepting chemotaxis protein